MMFRIYHPRYLILLELLALATLLIPTSAAATPAFARQEHESCEECHTAYPALNATGRLYKMNGYTFDTSDHLASKTDFEKMMSQFPIAAVITSRPYDKKKSGKKEIRAIHEAELIAGGNYRKIATYVDIEAEGEDGFGLVNGTTSMGYEFTPAVHLQVAYAPSFFSDPYDTLSDMRRMTVSHYNITDDNFSGVDGQLRHPRQQVSLFGHVADRLFYDVSVGGLTDDMVGQDSTVYLGRLAWDVNQDWMVGTFGVSGTCETSSSNCTTQARNFDRYGIDTQADLMHQRLRLTAVYMQAHDQYATGSAKEQNADDYVQAVMFMPHHWVPLLRYQSSQQNDGHDHTDRIIAGLSYYPMPNAKGMLEYSQDTHAPTGQIKDDRLTIQLQLAL
ncbi:MAG: hypothetical protein R3219_04400 [Hydrogenovibrio sp.]|nr:hypothetical protein [Hydrogenovibrio sp.]